MIFLLLLLVSNTPTFAQRDYYTKRAAVYATGTEIILRATLLKTKQDYLIISDTGGEQMVVWLTRYSELRKKHRRPPYKTRKAYLEELVPGTTAKLKLVRDKAGRLLVNKLTVHDTIQEFVPVIVEPTQTKIVSRQE
ncbi:MAG: hypothetical protein AB1489_19675 [Acidobacteriota bacterium]